MTEEVENNVDNRLDILEYVREDDVDKVRAFLEAGGEVNICSVQTGRTLLHIACRQVSCGRIQLDISTLAICTATRHCYLNAIKPFQMSRYSLRS